MTHIKFIVPGQPIAKGRPIAGRGFGGRTTLRTPAKTVNYEGLVAHTCAQAMAGTKPYGGPVAVDLTVEVAIPQSWSRKRQGEAVSGTVAATKRPDLDNCAKALLDGMNGIAFADDSQIVELNVIKRYSETPRVLVCVRELEMEAA